MADQSENYERFAYYDRETDIVRLPVGPLGDVSGEQTEWGVVSRDAETGAVVSIEVWSASERLPREILDALPDLADPDGPA